MKKKYNDLTIIKTAAMQYQENLVSKRILVISQNKNKKVEVIEIEFNSSSFLHLVGVKTKLSPNNFFLKVITGRLQASDWDYKKDGTTSLKIGIIKGITEIYKNAKMVGIYNGNRIKLSTDVCIGNVSYYLGLVKTRDITEFNNPVYVPNTAISYDIRKEISIQNKIVAIYRKNKDLKYYKEATYVAKNINLNEIKNQIPQYFEERFKNNGL